MMCPHCHHESKAPVMETRVVKGEVFRRRGCGYCGEAFVTIETAPPGQRMPAEANSVARAETYRARKAKSFPTLNWRSPK